MQMSSDGDLIITILPGRIEAFPERGISFLSASLRSLDLFGTQKFI